MKRTITKALFCSALAFLVSIPAYSFSGYVYFQSADGTYGISLPATNSLIGLLADEYDVFSDSGTSITLSPEQELILSEDASSPRYTQVLQELQSRVDRIAFRKAARTALMYTGGAVLGITAVVSSPIIYVFSKIIETIESDVSTD